MIYGQKFAEQFGGSGNAKDAMMVWAAATADWDEAQLTEAFKRCVKRESPWPPTLPEFIALMKDPNRHASWEIYKALPKPEPDLGKAEQAIQAMRGALGKTR